ncbi:putative PLATZ transcription factor family protein [Melia azedarach]|uniref:PLATZ transcription factor family protein n=1 Tax=Melia azedarach TaxID=155640 RepID=A0ACC1XGU2_MELAZ|nr:putative PLATZ transcription factor family protein [Melia azedarach]
MVEVVLQDKYAVVPPWVIVMYNTMFFRNCMNHLNTKKNELDRFCIDCLCSFCSHCIPAHTRHKHVKIRRYVYSDVINRHDLCKLFNCSGIQTYHTNKTKVLFLKQRNHPHQQQQPQINSKDYSCTTCDRNLQDHSLYCSIACKVVAIFGDKHREEIIDNNNNGVLKHIHGDHKDEEYITAQLMIKKRKRRRSRKGVPLRAPIL